MRSEHPLLTIPAIANAALGDLTQEFEALYPARLGPPPIVPERLLSTDHFAVDGTLS